MWKGLSHHTHKMSDQTDTPLNAKERRKLRREQERKQHANVLASTTPPAPTPSKKKQQTRGLEAKASNNRDPTAIELYKRVDEVKQRREKIVESFTLADLIAQSEEMSNQQEGNGNVVKGSLNSKQRRLLKRAIEREDKTGIYDILHPKTEEELKDENEVNRLENEIIDLGEQKRQEEGTKNSNNNKKRKHEDTIVEGKGGPYIVFVGQLAYSTTDKMLKDYFVKNGIEGDIQVRLNTNKDTKRSKGTAFVQLINAEQMYKCLSLHHTRLDGRIINVERSAGGRKNSSKRVNKITEARKEQEAIVLGAKERIINELTEQGVLKKDELDEEAYNVLARYDAGTIDMIMKAYTAEDRDRLRNRSAFFMMMAKRVVEEGYKPEGLTTTPDKGVGSSKRQKISTSPSLPKHSTKNEFNDANKQNNNEKKSSAAFANFSLKIGGTNTSSSNSGEDRDEMKLEPKSKTISNRFENGGENYDLSAVFGHR